MRPLPPTDIHVVRKEEKEAKLTAFIRRNLGARRAGAARGGTYLLFARSLESPVARALLSAGSEATELDLRIRLIVMLDDAVARDLAGTAGERLDAVAARVATDMRLLDAHEFLVLGDSTVWIGDCMRRDPSKCDAYEFSSDNAKDSARAAIRSFERLWGASAPLLLRRLPGDVPNLAAIAAEAAPSNVEVATRH
jgi:hypothetical protein